MAKRTTKVPKGLMSGVAIGLAFLALVVLASYLMSSSTGKFRGPLDPGVQVRDLGSQRSKCVSCENQAGVQGGTSKCLTCTQPSFKYLSETIVATREAKENAGVVTGCRGCP